MPSDANGVFSLVDGYLAITGETIQASQHNPVLEDIAASMSARLMRSGVAPMTGALKLADGSVGSPGLKFNTDGTSGFYKTTNGIGVSIGGTKVAEFTSLGPGRMIGELIPYAGVTAPGGWVFLYGQNLSRAAYADLWTFAQTEIAAGSTLFNNGDGSTTFGVADLRGRVVAGNDAMGGVAASRLTSAYFGSTAAKPGAVGGAQGMTLVQSHLPAVPLSISGNVTVTTTNQVLSSNAQTSAFTKPDGLGTSFLAFAAGSTQVVTFQNSTGTITSGSTSNMGSGAAFAIIQPTIITNYILYAGA